MSPDRANNDKIQKSDGPSQSLRPPTLGGYLRAARQTRALSRDQLAIAASVSTSYITQLELGEKAHPSAAALQSIAAALDLDDRQLEHLYHLARVDPEQIEDAHARRKAREPADLAGQLTPEMLLALDQLEPTLAAYVDQRWNLLAANKSYAHAFPGTVEAGNVLRWYFTAPEAKRVLIDWDTEAALTVKRLRGYLGNHTDDKWAATLLAELSQSPDFVNLWLKGEVAFDRETPYINLRDLDTGVPYSIITQIHEVATNDPHAHIGVYLGTRIPFSAPT